MGTITLAPPVLKAPAEYISDVMNLVRAKNPAEPEFHQAVQEVLESLGPVLTTSGIPSKRILERIVEPERVIMFRVPWLTITATSGQSRIPHRDEQRHRPL